MQPQNRKYLAIQIPRRGPAENRFGLWPLQQLTCSLPGESCLEPQDVDGAAEGCWPRVVDREPHRGATRAILNPLVATVLKKEKSQVKLIQIIYCTYPTISKILSFQHVANIKSY